MKKVEVNGKDYWINNLEEALSEDCPGDCECTDCNECLHHEDNHYVLIDYIKQEIARGSLIDKSKEISELKEANDELKDGYHEIRCILSLKPTQPIEGVIRSIEQLIIDYGKKDKEIEQLKNSEQPASEYPKWMYVWDGIKPKKKRLVLGCFNGLYLAVQGVNEVEFKKGRYYETYPWDNALDIPEDDEILAELKKTYTEDELNNIDFLRKELVNKRNLVKDANKHIRETGKK